MKFLGRICGLLFCNRCCSYEPQVKLAGYSESNIRLCSYCSSTLLKLPKTTSAPTTSTNPQYLLSTSINDHSQQQQIQQLSQDINTSDNTFNSDHFSLSKTSNDYINNDSTLNTSEQILANTEMNLKTSQQQQQQQQSQQRTNFNLKSLFNEIFHTQHGLQMQSKRVFIRSVECVSGKDIVDWLIKNQRATILSEAKLLCQCFINESYLEPVVTPSTSFIEFKPDQTLYKFGKVKPFFLLLRKEY